MVIYTIVYTKGKHPTGSMNIYFA